LVSNKAYSSTRGRSLGRIKARGTVLKIKTSYRDRKRVPLSVMQSCGKSLMQGGRGGLKFGRSHHTAFSSKRNGQKGNRGAAVSALSGGKETSVKKEKVSGRKKPLLISLYRGPLGASTPQRYSVQKTIECKKEFEI